MRRIKKLVSLVLAMMLVLGLSATAFADEEVTGTGSITIKNQNGQSVAGRTFAAYKILDVRIFQDGEDFSYVYAIPDELQDIYTELYGTTDVDTVIEEINKADMSSFAKTILEKLMEAGIQPEQTVTAGSDAESVKIDGLSLGYYVIEDESDPDEEKWQAVSALMIDTTTPNVEINIKADAPTLKKEIVKKETGDGAEFELKDEKGNGTTSGSASIGDQLFFEVTSTVPNMEGYEKYTFKVTDTMGVGFDFQDDIVVTIGGEEIDKANYTVTVSPDNWDGSQETIITIEFNEFIKWKEQAGEEIKISYSAVVTKDASTGVTPNTNKVQLEYSNDPKDSDVTGETPEQVTYTYITKVQITKVDPSGKVLTGAEFEITGTMQNIVLVKGTEYVKAGEGETAEYYLLKDDTYTKQAPTDATRDQYVSETPEYVLKQVDRFETDGTTEVSAKAFVDENGVLIFDGLSAGEYTITETTVPDGYNGIDPIKLVIKLVIPESESGSTDCQWEYSATIGGEDVSGTTPGTIELTVVNQAGQTLPSTGGIGTTMFYVIGAVLVLGAGILLVVKKRMSSN